MEHTPHRTDIETDSPLRLTVQNVGGITDADIALSEGVTLLSGRNASNKSSLLRALAGVLGGPVPPLKNDAESGTVRLSLTDTSYELALGRQDGRTVVTESERYASCEELCSLFVALTETNPIRQAILTGEELYDLLMRPVDTAAIKSELSRLRDRRDELEARLEELDTFENRLPGLETRRESLQNRETELERELRAKRDEVETREASSDDVAEELQERRAERSSVRSRVRTQEEAIESLEVELEDVRTELAEIADTPMDDSVEDITAELETLHRQKQELTSIINTLSPIVDMNAQLLDDDADIPTWLTSDTVVSELDPASQRVECWTCGSTVEKAQIADQVQTIETIIAEKRRDRDSVTSRIETLTDRRQALESRADRIETLRDRREDITDEIDRRRETVEEQRSELRDLESDIETLQTEAADETADGTALNELYDDISDLEYERGSVVTDLESVTAEIDELRSELATRGDVEAELESVRAQLREQRQRIVTIEQDLVGTFNEMMQQVLDALSYDAIERIWLERRSSGDGNASATSFELHVVRATDEGAVYDDTIDSLSKSEREVIGLIVALAGYLVHDVGDVVPFLVVDAVEMFDADRIDGLMGLFGDHAEFVVAAVLPEEADRLQGSYETISTQTFVGMS